MATWQQNIEVYTREISISDLSSAQLGVIISDTVNEWVEKAPIELLYKHASESLDLTNSGINIEDYKVIKVIRDGKLAVLKEVDKHYLFTDTTSLHYASTYTPVWYVENVGKAEVTGDTAGPYVKVFPLLATGEEARLYVFRYLESVSASSETTVSIPGLPPRMVPLITLSSAEKVLSHKLGMMVHEEEDSEVSQIINQQLNYVRQQMMEQATRIGVGTNQVENKLQMYTKGQQ